jgi:hypothetical protein
MSDVATYAGSWRRTTFPAPRHTATLAGVPLAYESKPSFNEADLSDTPYGAHPQLNTSDRAALAKQYLDRLESLRAMDDLIGTIPELRFDRVEGDFHVGPLVLLRHEGVPLELEVVVHTLHGVILPRPPLSLDLNGPAPHKGMAAFGRRERAMASPDVP